MFPATVLSAPPATSSLLPACATLQDGRRSLGLDTARISSYICKGGETHHHVEHSQICWKRDGVPFGPANSTWLTALGSHSEAHRDREFPTSSTGYSSH